MGVPQWLAQHLVDSGHWDVNGIGRNARGRRCRDCGEYVIAGLDADSCAGVAHVDPAPLSALGEAMALIAGRDTYSLRREGRTYRIDHRHRWAIERTPAGSDRLRADIVAEHRCADPGPSGPLALDSVLTPSPKVSNDDLQPPF